MGVIVKTYDYVSAAVIFILGAVIGLVIVSTIGCSNNGSVVGPDTTPVKQTEQATTVAPAPKPVPTPDPNADGAYVTLNGDGSGVFCAAKIDVPAYVFYTVPMTHNNYGIKVYWAKANTCVLLPPASATGIVFPWCGSQKVQIDVALGSGSGEHLGHVFADVDSTVKCPKPTPTPSPEPTPTPSPSPTPSPDPSPTPSPEPSPTPSPEPSPTPSPEPSPTPTPGLCYYNVPGSDGKDECMAQPGYVSWNENNHLCALAYPGVSQKGFNLNPGQSADGCLSK